MKSGSTRGLLAVLGLVIAGGSAPGCSRPEECAAGLAEYPAWNGHDLDCRDVGRRVCVTGADPHRLDADRDGVGCEGW